MIDATSFADAEAALIAAIKTAKPDLRVSNQDSNVVPSVVVGYSGGGSRSWGEAKVNCGIRVIDANDNACRLLVRAIQDILAATSNDDLIEVKVPAGGGVSIPRQTPPVERYFAVTACLRGKATI